MKAEWTNADALTPSQTTGKSILVIDMPKNCEECPLRLWDSESQYYNACTPTLKEKHSVTDEYEECEDILTRPIWCPLKPMPEKKEVSDDAYVADYTDFDLGWNACIEEIEK